MQHYLSNDMSPVTRVYTNPNAVKTVDYNKAANIKKTNNAAFNYLPSGARG